MSTSNLGEILLNRSWTVRKTPFRHVVADNVFTREFYLDLSSEFELLLKSSRLSRSNVSSFVYRPQYHMHSASLMPETQGPLGVMISREWHDLLASMFQIRATGDVNGGLHHHEVGSRSGGKHNDFNPGWFVARPELDETEVAVSDGACDYRHGTCQDSSVQTVERVRAVAMLYYLSNVDWMPHFGGTTTLHSTLGPVYDFDVAPRNNSLLAFECTPHSFHSFKQNKLHPRNSIILWLHQSKEDAMRKWGCDNITKWP